MTNPLPLKFKWIKKLPQKNSILITNILFKKTVTETVFFMCARYGQQLDGESPLQAW